MLVVNGTHCRNFPGRKTDMKDCQWLAVLVQCMGAGKHTWLACFYRRIRAKRGAKVAIKATAYKLAKLIYLVLKNGWDYLEQGMAKYKERIRQQELKALQKLAKRLDYVLLPKSLTPTDKNHKNNSVHWQADLDYRKNSNRLITT